MNFSGIWKIAVPGFLLASAMLFSCGKKGDTGPVGPAGPRLTGDLNGFVYLVNADGFQPQKKDSITISIEGTAISTAPDSTGKWSINNLEAGIYTIDFNRPGYGLTKAVQTQFVGGGDRNLGNVYLCQPPAFYVSNFAVRKDTVTVVNFKFFLSDTNVDGEYRVAIFMGHDTLVSSTPGTYAASSFLTLTFKSGVDSTNNEARLLPAAFINDGLTGSDSLTDSIFAVAYTANAGSNNSGYLDLNTGKTVFTNLNTTRSNIIKIAVP